ncbi:MAG TPA: RNA methyltransferase [Myxococcota bacterium]|nr:RNA methyltransferase [Myxococcota bacterium]
MSLGYFEVAVYQPKAAVNVGTLWRTAYQLGCAGLHVIGERWKRARQASDTVKSWRHVPAREWSDFDAFFAGLPHDAPLVGVEMGGKPLAQFTHPERAVYLLGAEDYGIPRDVLSRCHQVVSLESVRTESFNVAVAGAIVLYDRVFSR